MSKIKIRSIEISVLYEDNDGETQIVGKKALDFESAEEVIGKLQRFMEKITNENES